jgi:DNA-binding PadR family transcriptional regulator
MPVPTPAPPPPDALNQTARVLLGMIAEGHCTGYAIKAEIERSTRLFWGASAGGIYPELKRLAAAGLVDVRDDPRGGARRHSYSLTATGHAALAAWLTDESDPAFEMRNEGLLKLRFAAVLDPCERAGLVDRMRAHHEARIEALQAQLEADAFDDVFDRLTAEYALGLNTWARDWCASNRETVAASD